MLDEGSEPCLERRGELGGIRPALPFDADSPQRGFPPQDSYPGAMEEGAIHKCAVGLSHGPRYIGEPAV